MTLLSKLKIPQLLLIIQTYSLKLFKVAYKALYNLFVVLSILISQHYLLTLMPFGV